MYKHAIYIAITIQAIALVGCSSQKVLFEKPGNTIEQFNKDKYDCVQQSRVSWGGGGTGELGLIMIFSSKSSAEKQSKELFKMCMEARGYTAREVSDEEFDAATKNTLKGRTEPFIKERAAICDNEEYKIIFEKTPCKSEDITVAQLFDNSKLTDHDKNTFIKLRKDISDVSNRMLDTIFKYGNTKDKELASYAKECNIDIEEKTLELVEGKMTWGEYNKARKELDQNLKKEKSRIYNVK